MLFLEVLASLLWGNLIIAMFIKLAGQCDILCDPVLHRPREADHCGHSPWGGTMSVPDVSGQNHAVHSRRGGSPAWRCSTNSFIGSRYLVHVSPVFFTPILKATLCPSNSYLCKTLSTRHYSGVSISCGGWFFMDFCGCGKL